MIQLACVSETLIRVMIQLACVSETLIRVMIQLACVSKTLNPCYDTVSMCF